MGAALFDIFYPYLWIIEGGETTDYAGLTRYGLSLRYFKTLDPALADLDGDGDVDEADLRAVKPEDAKRITKATKWDAFGLDRFPAKVALALGDGIFHGGGVLGMQQSLNDLRTMLKLEAVAEDGQLGPVTAQAILRACQLPGAEDILVRRYLLRRARYFNGLAAKRPDLYLPQLVGWGNRLLALEAFIFRSVLP